MDLDFTSVVVALATLFVGIWFGGRSDRFNRRAGRRGERAELAQQIAEALKPVRTDIAGLRDANETAHAAITVNIKALDRRIDDLRGHFDTRFDEQGQRIKSIDRRTGGIEAHLRGRGASASARD